MLGGNEVFYDHYQIDLNDEPDETEVEPKKKRKGELKTEYVGSHSPFGIVWQIAAATGWPIRYILWSVNYQTLRMMLADAPRYVKKKEKPRTLSGFVQSRLKQKSKQNAETR